MRPNCAALWLIGTLLLLLSGCADIHLPSDEELAAVADGHKTLTLFRVTGSTEGQPVALLTPSGEGYTPFTLANLSAPDDQPLVRIASQLRQASTDGWVYAILDPGTWQLEAAPDKRFQFHVDGIDRLLYAGSLHKEVKGRPTIFGHVASAAGEFTLRDESAAARSVLLDAARPGLAAKGTVTSLMYPTGTPAARDAVARAELDKAVAAVAARVVADLQP